MAIYASNGTMKTSLAKTLEAVAKDAPDRRPRDDIYPEREAVCDILDKNGGKNRPRVDPGDKSPYESVPNTDDMATGILVNPRLRDQYRAAVAGIAGAEKNLLERLSDKSGVKRGEVEDKLLADLGAARHAPQDTLRHARRCPRGRRSPCRAGQHQVPDAVQLPDRRGLARPQFCQVAQHVH